MSSLYSRSSLLFSVRDTGGVPIDVGGALRQRRLIIDDSPTAISDYLDLDRVGPDEVVRLVTAWAPKAIISVLSRRGGHLYNRRRRGASENWCCGNEVFGNNLSNELGMMGLIVAAVRAHNLLAIPARRG